MLPRKKPNLRGSMQPLKIHEIMNENVVKMPETSMLSPNKFGTHEKKKKLGFFEAYQPFRDQYETFDERSGLKDPSQEMSWLNGKEHYNLTTGPKHGRLDSVRISMPKLSTRFSLADDASA